MNNIIKTRNEFGYFSTFRNDQFIGKTLLTGEPWDKTKILKIAQHIKQESTVLDIGANIGTHSIPYSNFVGSNGTVHAFEPQHEIFKLLHQNIIDNNKTNIKTHHCAIGHENNTTVSISNTMHDRCNEGQPVKYNTNDEVNYGGVELGIGNENVNMYTIDSFDFRNVSFMKVDVEGCEKMVFYGAQEMIRRERPVILFEDKKTISNEMRKIMNISKRVERFSIIDLCMNELGYVTQKKMKRDILLIPAL
jgi:FkbM family methyltransferase